VISLESIRQAKDNLKKIINSTPLQFSQTFTDLTKAPIFMKPECLQKNGSFKIRGAYTMLHRMTDEEKARGIVTFSAGNWAQGVAYAASLLKIKAVVILPEWCNRKKVEATKGYGAEVIIYGKDSQQLSKKALEQQEQKKYVYINPFSNLNMMAGTASIGIEIIEEKPDTEVIVVPIGGGALISGIAMGAKYLKPEVKVYGVQPFGANAIYQSLKKGDIVEVKIETIADGSGPGHHVYIAERVDINIIFLLMQFNGLCQKLLRIFAVDDDFRSIPFGGLYFFSVTPFR